MNKKRKGKVAWRKKVDKNFALLSGWLLDFEVAYGAPFYALRNAWENSRIKRYVKIDVRCYERNFLWSPLNIDDGEPTNFY